jgi:glycosyltransferase involved in cell wall biosynthesis
MKIILSVNTLGSFISHRRGLYLRLRDEYQVQVILPDSEDHNAAQKEIPASQLLSISMSRKGTNPFAEVRSIVDFFQQYRKNKPDLVHHFTIKPVIYGTLAARIAGVPKIVNSITGLGFVFTSDSLKAKVLGVIVKNLYRFCFSSPKVKVIFQNTDDRDFFVKHGIIDKDRCFLVEGSGVDVQKFAPQPTQNLEPKILVASRLLIEKGIAEFMNAVQILKKQGLKFEAVIAGDIDPGNPGSFTESQFKEWQQSGLATFLGFQSDMVSVLKPIDIACLPSYREGLPMALLEAMAAGKAIVTTDAPGCRSTVRNGLNGFLVPIKDSNLLAEALSKLIQDRNLREKMGAESRNLAVNLFSKEKITSEILKVYNS